MPIPAPPQWCERHATNCLEPLFALCPTGPPCLPAGPVLHFAAMTRAMLEKRLIEIGAQLRDLRNELAVVDEQFAHFADEADDARLRSLVSETPLAEREHRVAARHANAMGRHRNEVVTDIGRLEQQQDELLDRLNDVIA